MNNYHGYNKKSSYFEGWYFKIQNEASTIAFIPGINIGSNGIKSAFIQIISNKISYFIEYDASDFKVNKKRLGIKIGECCFSENGIKINIENNDFNINGLLYFDDLIPVKYDAMGPFSLLQFLECNHGVISLHHNVNGKLFINSQELIFTNGIGYIEKDWGNSFPKCYEWLQCNSFLNEKCSIMVSIAEIPFMGFNFKGCICIIYYHGKEYRLATYTGVKIIKADKNQIYIKQGGYRLKINIFNKISQKLIAPADGDMKRNIAEGILCDANFKFYYKNNLIFNLRSNRASFEYVE